MIGKRQIIVLAFFVGVLAVAGKLGAMSSSSPETGVRIRAIEGWFNSFKTMKATFTQLNPDGSRSTGAFYLWRPGRLKLIYDNYSGKGSVPSGNRVLVANGGNLYDHNPSLDETTEIPLDATPADFILRKHVRFADDIRVMGYQEKNGLIFLGLAKRDDPEAGNLTLVFNSDPLVLTEWRIVDSQKVPTHVILDNIETGVKLDPALFRIDF